MQAAALCSRHYRDGHFGYTVLALGSKLGRPLGFDLCLSNSAHLSAQATVIVLRARSLNDAVE